MEKQLKALNLSLRALESPGKESQALSSLSLNLQLSVTFLSLKHPFHPALLNSPTPTMAMMASLKSHLWKCPTWHSLMAILIQEGLWACFLAGLAKIKRSCSPKMSNIASVTLTVLWMLLGASLTIVAMALNAGKLTYPT